MAEDALFNLRWDAQRSALLGSMASFYAEEAFVDTTIVADNKMFKTHKLLLSASSSYLRNMLESVPSTQHAVIFMPHISASDLGNLLKFIYDGEIKINKRSLKSFLSVAKMLKIKGMDFDLNEDLEANTNAQNLSSTHSSSSPNPYKRYAKDARLDEDPNVPGSLLTIPSKTSAFEPMGKLQKDLIRSPPSDAGGKEKDVSGLINGHNSDEDALSRPALISGSGRSTDSISSQSSANERSPRSEHSRLVIHHNHNHTNSGDEGSRVLLNKENRKEDGTREDNDNDSTDKNGALNLHVSRFQRDSESLDMDQDSSDIDEDGGGLTIVNNEEDDYDDDDDGYSMSIQPEVSIRESDESYNINDRQPSLPFKPTSFSNSLNLSLLNSSAMTITQTPGGLGSPLSSHGSSPLSLQQLTTLKHLSKLGHPVAPKAHHQIPGQGSPQSGGISAISEGILMRMMREPLQASAGKGMSSPSHSGFFDISHADPNLHSAGLRKHKRYVQCTSCSKVLSSLSALKRHMEDVHCARIQGKCLLCGRVYSSRNSLLTHVYSSHKKNPDYRAVARIIRESEFEQFATA